MSEEPLETAYLDTVTNHSGTRSWICEIKINYIFTPFKIDTGAEVSAICEATFSSLTSVKLNKPTKNLQGPDRKPLNVLGSVHVCLKYKEKCTTQEVHVIKGLNHNLLGLPAVEALQLVAKLDTVQDETVVVKEKFPSLFNGLGSISTEYTIRLKPGATPYALSTARKVPIPLREKVHAELQRMQDLGVISKVDHPTPWCAGMVVVPKKTGEVRICVDLKPLNANVLRKTHPLPAVDEVLAQLTGAAVFSKLDANSGFWQVPLSATSKYLTTFITPFGRYCFNKLPFGITSASEHFQKRMNAIVEGYEGTLCLMDDILVFGKTKAEHDKRPFAVLEQLQKAGVTLNTDKCEFWRDKLTFLGHIVSKEGISPDPTKTEAIRKMSTPTNVTELRRFMGMVNQLGKFSSHIAELSSPLRGLLSSKNAWSWDASQEDAFMNIKAELTKPTVLALYNPKAATKISADASSHGLGAVLLQLNEYWQPVAYASRALTDTESRYAQIEKEALAVTWACERFSCYIIGKQIEIETDHKPLVPLLSCKPLEHLPPRVVRFRLRMMRFDYSIQHVPGKLLYTADALSRATNQDAPTPDQITSQDEVESYIDAVVSHSPASRDRFQQYCDAQHSDATCSQVIAWCKTKWPEKHAVKGDLKPYWQLREELSLYNDLLLFRDRIVVPKDLRRQTIEKIHQGHQGITRCRLRVRSSVWWPGISKEVDSYVKQCPHCEKSVPQAREPLITTPLPAFPWERIGVDLFELHKSSYLIVVDYFSRYPEAIKLKSTTSKSEIEVLKSIFSRHGVPVVLVSDNGPQFASGEMQAFAKSYSFSHVTSSPHYHQSNGMVERTVRTVKQLLKNAPDPYLALLSYRATPLSWCDKSPSELLMGRKVRTDIPQTDEHFLPDWPFLSEFRKRDMEHKRKQKENYDEHHRTRSLDPLPTDSTVWVRTGNTQIPGTVTATAGTPRSYLIDTPTGQLRRNRSHLSHRTVNEETTTTESNNPASSHDINRSPVMTRSRAGIQLKPPDRLTL